MLNSKLDVEEFMHLKDLNKITDLKNNEKRF